MEWVGSVRKIENRIRGSKCLFRESAGLAWRTPFDILKASLKTKMTLANEYKHIKAM